MAGPTLGGDRGLTSVPGWARWTIVGVVAALFAASAVMLVASVAKDGRDAWALAAAAFAETAGTGLLVLLVLFFVERGRSPRAVAQITEGFLLREVPRALRDADVVPPAFVAWREDMAAQPSRSQVTVKASVARGASRGQYLVHRGASTVRVVAELNVERLNVVVVIPGADGETAQAAYAALADTVRGAEHAGYVNGQAYEEDRTTAVPDAGLGWPRSLAHSFWRNLDADRVYDPAYRQFLAQDLGIMVRSLMAERDAGRARGDAAGP